MGRTAQAPASAVTFTRRVRADLIGLAGQVEAATQDKSRYIVDARLTRFYNGDGGGYPRPGHIPTAVNIPISSVSVNGFLRPRAELEALFTAQQVDRSKPVITYCHIGQQATLLWFVATLLDRDARPVPYPPLTLPTTRQVYNTAVACSSIKTN